MLFEKVKRERLNNFDIKLDTGNSSKSYGSSPNGSNFDYFMQRDYFNRDKFDISGYGFDKICEGPTTTVQRPLGGYLFLVGRNGNCFCGRKKYGYSNFISNPLGVPSSVIVLGSVEPY